MTLVETLVDLIDIPSVTGDEGRIATHIAERMLPTYGRTGVDRIGNSLIVGERTGRPMMLLVGHLDTVPGVPGAQIIDETVVGLGASDMKSGLAVMLHLLEDPAVRTGPYDVIGVFYDKEEGTADNNGLEPVLEHADWLSDAVFAVVLEPTDLEVQVGCVGALNATLVFRGKAAHSARPWLGENAITKAGRWLAMMHRRAPEPVEVEGFRFWETFTVTTASGGTARNVVPAEFAVNVNHRFAPSRTFAEAEERLRSVASEADEVQIVDRAPAAPVAVEGGYLDALVAATGADVGPKQAWTDVARLAGRGVSGVNYGPGETRWAHQAGERVPAEHLTRAFEGLRRFLLSPPGDT